MLHRFASHLTDRRIDALVLFAGALTPLAFAPFQLFPLAVIAPAILFVSWNQASAARAARRGFLYGVGLFGVGVSWVYVSLHTYGYMPAPLAGFAVALLVTGLALFPAGVGWVQARFGSFPAGLRLALFLPALWVVFEWTRGWFLTGFPWLNLGYSQTDTPLAGLAPWIGVYGMSFAVVTTAGVFAAAWLDRRRAIWYLPAAALLWVGAWFAGQPEWAQPTGSPIKIALVQANVPITVKWRPEQREAIVNRYIELSEQAPRAQLIVWPEAAVPGYFDMLAPALVPSLERSVRGRDTTFLIGAVERDTRAREYYNSVFAVGAQTGSYRKQHLVPFGEFLPWPAAFGWLIDHLHIPMSNFNRGTAGQPLLVAAGQPIGVSVCYEDAFGEEIIKALPTATLLVNVSEDSWFGNSLAPHQRLQMARVRALESARPMLRAANTGPSAIIDHRGNVIARSPQFAAYVLAGEIQPMSGATFYSRYGNAPVVVFVLLILLGSDITRRLSKNPDRSTQFPD
jgi:apolipoprotein N-acyltransferase